GCEDTFVNTVSPVTLPVIIPGDTAEYFKCPPITPLSPTANPGLLNSTSQPNGTIKVCTWETPVDCESPTSASTSPPTVVLIANPDPQKLTSPPTAPFSTNW